MANDFVIKKPKEITVTFDDITVEVHKGGNATAADIREGKTAYVGGELIEGTIQDNGTNSVNITQMEQWVTDLNGKYIDRSFKVYSDTPQKYELALAICEDDIDTLDLKGLAEYKYLVDNSNELIIRDSCFAGLEVNSITFPQCVYPFYKFTLGDYCFSSSYGFDTLDFTNCRAKIGVYCFENCGDLVTLKGRINEMGTRAFQICENLETVDITCESTQGNQTISTNAFYGCIGLKKIITGQFKSVGNTAFRNCFEIKSVTFGNSMQTLGSNIFGNGSEAQSPQEFEVLLYCPPPTVQSTTFGNLTSGSNTMNIHFYIDDNYYSRYLEATNWVAIGQKWELKKMSERPNP